MNKLKAIGYIRISPLLQEDPQSQISTIKKTASNSNIHLVEELIERSFSGKSEKRPELDKVVEMAKNREFSILIVSSLDRLGKSHLHLLKLIEKLDAYGVSLISVSENIDLSSPAQIDQLNLVKALNQLSSRITSERIKLSLAIKKNISQLTGSELRLGRPSISNDTKEKIIRLRKGGMSIRKISDFLGNVSKSTVERVINAKKAHED